MFPGTAPSHMLSAFFKKHGVDPATISMVQLPPQAQISSLESGAVDALFAYERVTSTTALVHGGYRQLFGLVMPIFADPCPRETRLIAASFPERNHPQSAAGAVRTLQQGVDYMAAHPAESRKLLTKYIKLPPEIASRVNVADVTLSNQVDIANLQQFIDLLYQTGEIPQRIDAHSCYCTRVKPRPDDGWALSARHGALEFNRTSTPFRLRSFSNWHSMGRCIRTSRYASNRVRS